MIRIIRTSKDIDLRETIKFHSFEELERHLKKISSYYYDNYNFFIESDNFETLKRYFAETYNEDYYVIDDLLEAIVIQRLKRGRKRLKRVTRVKLSDAELFDRFLKRLENDYDFIYDELLNIIELRINGLSFVLTLNIERTKIDNITFKDIDDLELFINSFKETKKFKSKLETFGNRLNKREP